MTNYPTAWQRRVLWTVTTYLAIAAGGAVAVEMLSLFGQAVGFLQPVLIPFFVAAVLAFLLDPIVRLLNTRTRLSRTGSVLMVFSLVLLTVTLLGALVVPRVYASTARMIQGLPAYMQKAQGRLTHLLDVSEARFDKLNNLFPGASPSPSPTASPGELPSEDGAGATPAVGATPLSQETSGGSATVQTKGAVERSSPSPMDGAAERTRRPSSNGAAAGADPLATPEGMSFATPQGNEELAQNEVAAALGDGPPAVDAAGSPTPSPVEGKEASGNKAEDNKPSVKELLAPHGIRNYIQKQIPSLEARVPALLDSLLHLLLKGISVAGLLVDAVIIPVYLYFLLVEAHNIARHWNEYLPIRDSPFKKEVVSVLLEINGYLAAFFRGQLLVSTIDGILIGSMLAFVVHLDFAFFIGLLVVVLTFIPYLGFILCYIPVLLLAIIQYGDWQHPLLAVGVMFVTQLLESTIIAPKVVGDSVGLHPVTVILSVFGWSLLLNGPIGAILAVPLSATVKVLLRRYIWEKSGHGRHLVPLGAESVAVLEEENVRTEEAAQGKSEADEPRVTSKLPPMPPPEPK